MRIREATSGDAAAVHGIYTHHVLRGVGTFEEDPPEVTEIATRMHTGHWLVAEDSAVRGYAYYAPYRSRSAYRFTVENSIYVHPDAVGRGIGHLLLAPLVAHARAAGLRQMVAAIGSSDNDASIALHQRHGFRPVGVLRDVGVKFGRTLDVVLLQLDLR